MIIKVMGSAMMRIGATSSKRKVLVRGPEKYSTFSDAMIQTNTSKTRMTVSCLNNILRHSGCELTRKVLVVDGSFFLFSVMGYLPHL
jgi:hypothetical protein